MWCEPLGLVRFHTPAMFIPGSFSMQRIMSLSNLSNASKVSPLSHFSWYSEWFQPQMDTDAHGFGKADFMNFHELIFPCLDSRQSTQFCVSLFFIRVNPCPSVVK